MKAYLMSIPETIKGISNKLNVKSLLCDKSWVIFNNEGIKIVYIFQKDGSLITSQSGVVTKSKWEYVKANKSILIEENNQSLLLHPTFVDEVLFILRQDGTDYHIVMIDESKYGKLLLLTIDAINEYLKTASDNVGKNALEMIQKEQQEHKFKLREEARVAKQQEIEDATLSIRKKRKTSNVIFIVLMCISVPLLYMTDDTTINFITIFVIIVTLFIWIFFQSMFDDKTQSIKNRIIDQYINDRKDA